MSGSAVMHRMPRQVSALEELARDCLAEVLTFFGTPKEWLALQLTCKQLKFDMLSKETAWGMINARFTFYRGVVSAKCDAKLPNDHIRYVRLESCDVEMFMTRHKEEDYREEGLLDILQLGYVEKLEIEDLYGNELRHLCTHLSTKPTWPLISLNLEGVKLQDLGVVTLAKGLLGNTTLAELNLTNVGLGSDGAIALAETLALGSGLNYLFLYRNEIGDDGASAIAKFLKVATHLVDLNLSDNQIGEIGANAIVDGLRANKTLKCCDISSNGIGYDSVMENLARFFETCDSNLVNLDLSLSEIDNINAIVRILKANARLRILNLSNNGFGDDGAVAIAETLKSNTHLGELNLSYNQFGVIGLTALDETSAVNAKLNIISMPCILRGK
jgi:Ran GTPase-activating protein (RanGAP) involved in mRNA processing and transport